MKKRSVWEFIILCIVTFGIYWLVWLYKTKEEMVGLGAQIPTFILFFIPFANVWWMWKWAAGVDHVTKEAMSDWAAFLLCLFLGWIGCAFVLAKLNEVATETPAAS
jgi:hypothetical protein